MTSLFAQDRVTQAQALVARWSRGYVELWKYTRGHRGLRLRLVREPIPGCLLLYFGDVERYCGPLAWENSKLTLRAATSSDGSDVYIASDEDVGFEIRSAVIETHPRRERYPA